MKVSRTLASSFAAIGLVAAATMGTTSAAQAAPAPASVAASQPATRLVAPASTNWLTTFAWTKCNEGRTTNKATRAQAGYAWTSRWTTNAPIAAGYAWKCRYANGTTEYGGYVDYTQNSYGYVFNNGRPFTQSMGSGNVTVYWRSYVGGQSSGGRALNIYVPGV